MIHSHTHSLSIVYYKPVSRMALLSVYMDMEVESFSDILSVCSVILLDPKGALTLY